MNNSNMSGGAGNNTSQQVDEAFKSAAYTRLVETGERERLMQHLKSQLAACGWEEELRRFCTKVVSERGVESVTMDDLVAQVTPIARKRVPDKLREETMLRVRSFLTREMPHR